MTFAFIQSVYIHFLIYIMPHHITLASAAFTFNLQNRILSENLALIPDTGVTDTLAILSELSNNQIVNEPQKSRKKSGMIMSLKFNLRNCLTMPLFLKTKQCKIFDCKRTTIGSLAICYAYYGHQFTTFGRSY